MEPSEQVVDTADQTDHSVLGEQSPENNEETISKKEMRRIKKMQILKEKNKEKRKLERIRKKISWRKRKDEGEDMGASRKSLKVNKMSQSNCKQRIVIDCSFEHLMRDREISSLISQIQHCYGTNRRLENPIQFYLTNFNGKLKEKLECFGHYKSWDVNIKEESLMDVFDKKDIVYLSSESTNVLESLDDEKVYIIGGLIDHNHHKGLCHELAISNGVSHAQLPIESFIDLKSRKVLAINHVFDILLKYTETGNWKEAFHFVIPSRKCIAEKEMDSLDPSSSQETDSVDEEKIPKD